MAEAPATAEVTLRPPTPAERRRLVRWRVSTFWVLLLGYVGYYLCRKNLPAAFPLLESAFGYTNAQLAQIALWSEVAYAFGKLTGGPLGDRVGGRRVFLVGMLGAVAFNVAFSVSTSLAAFVVIWCLCRYFLAFGWGGVVKTMGAWYEPERNGTIMGWMSINFQFGGVAATLFAGWLVALGVGWRGLFVWPAVVLTAVFVWAALASRSRPDDVVPGTDFGRGAGDRPTLAGIEEDPRPRVPLREIIPRLLRFPIFRELLAFSFLTTALRSTFMFWTAKFLVDIGMEDSTAIFKSAIFPFLGCVGTVLLGWYTDRFAEQGDRARAMTALLLALTACLLGIGWTAARGLEHQHLLLALIGASGFFLLGPYSMASGCLTLDIAGSRAAGSASGMIDGVGYMGGALAAWGAGELSDVLGWPQVFGLLAVIGLLSAVSTWRMSRTFRSVHAAG